MLKNQYLKKEEALKQKEEHNNPINAKPDTS